MANEFLLNDKARTLFLWITATTASLLILCSIFLILRTPSFDMPAPPDLSKSPVDSVQEVKKKEIANYKELVSIIQKQQTDIYDGAVLKTLIKMFESLLTAAITYLFAEGAVRLFSVYMTKKYGNNGGG